MPRFGHFYAANQLVVFEITATYAAGGPMFVATLSADPRVAVRARRPEAAALQLQAVVNRLAPAARQHVA